MTSPATLHTDRLESFISSIDGYEPRIVRAHETAFRVFARFLSRALDGRYLDRHPTPELLVDLENLMAACMVRPEGAVRVALQEESLPDGLLEHIGPGAVISCGGAHHNFSIGGLWQHYAATTGEGNGDLTIRLHLHHLFQPFGILKYIGSKWRQQEAVAQTPLR